MAEGFVKAVFLGILGTTVALILYFILFGYTGTGNWSFRQGANNDTVGNNIINAEDDSNGWKGVLFYAAEAIEVPISEYYYTYCFNLAVEDYAYLDRVLGYKVNSKNTDLSSSDIASIDFDNAMHGSSTAVSRYTTEWK